MSHSLRRVVVLAFCVLLLALMPSALSAAGTIAVDAANPACVTGSGQSAPYSAVYCKIQDAVTDAASGDTINVAAGTYLEEVTITKQVSLLGAGFNSTKIMGPKTGGATTLQLSAPGVVVDGFTITRDGNTVTDWNSNVKSQGVIMGAGTTLQNCKVTGNRNGVYVNNNQNVTIRNNVITFNRTGIQVVNDVTDLVIAENEISDNWTIGLLFNAFTGAEIPTTAVTVFNNSIFGNWYGDVQSRFVGGGDLNVSGNWFGTTSVAQTFANSSEPSYAAQIPAAFGGTAANPGGAPNILGVSSAKIDYTPYLGVGTDTNIETTPGRGTNGFQGDFASLYVTAAGAQTGAASRIAEGVALVTPNGTVNVTAGAYSVPAVVDLNKAGITLDGAGAGATIVQVSGTGDRFDVSAAGVTLQDFEIVKTDKTGEQNIIRIRNNNISIKNNTIHGQYVFGDGEVSRAMVVNAGAFSGINIEGNTIYALRQPAYVSGTHTGTVQSNLVYGTRGWVLEGGDLTFMGNTWGTGNVFDIAILALCPSTYYTDLAALSAANNGAVIEDQRTTPATLSVVYVDARASAGGNGGQLQPYNDLNSAWSRVAPGGKIMIVGTGTYNVAAGTHPGGIVVQADDVEILGPGILNGNGTDPGVLVQSGADNFTLDGMEIKGCADGVQLAGTHESLKLVNNWLHDNGTGFRFNADTALTGVITINGNLFKFNTGAGIQNDSTVTTIPATYNSWGDIDGPAAATDGDGITGNVTATPFTFVEVYTDAALTPMNVVEGQTFTVNVQADAAGMYAVQYKLTYDPTLLQFQSITNGVFGACTTNTATAGVITSYCPILDAALDANATAALVNAITFKVAPDSSHAGQASWTTYLDLKHADGLAAAARDGVKVWVNNGDFGAPSSTAKDITDNQDGTIQIAGLSQYTGYIDLQGRTNDSGALLSVYNQAAVTSALLKATATSAASGKYTTAYATGQQLVISNTYYFQIDRALYLPTTRTFTPADTSWADSKLLDTRPFKALGTVVLLGGDADNNNKIEISDGACIGNNYGSTTPGVCGVDGSSDVTGDGKVDILDLTLMGGNYDKTSSPWTE